MLSGNDEFTPKTSTTSPQPSTPSPKNGINAAKWPSNFCLVQLARCKGNLSRWNIHCRSVGCSSSACNDPNLIFQSFSSWTIWSTKEMLIFFNDPMEERDPFPVFVDFPSGKKKYHCTLKILGVHKARHVFTLTPSSAFKFDMIWPNSKSTLSQAKKQMTGDSTKCWTSVNHHPEVSGLLSPENYPWVVAPVETNLCLKKKDSLPISFWCQQVRPCEYVGVEFAFKWPEDALWIYFLRWMLRKLFGFSYASYVKDIFHCSARI